MTPIFRTLALATGAALASLALPSQAAVVTWYATDGDTPDVVVPQWELVDNASPENPALSADVLTIGGNAIAEQMYYTMDGANADFSGQTSYWLEARLRVNTESLTAGWWRAPVTMAIRFDGGAVAVFELQRDAVYLRNGNNSVGAFSNTLDTDDEFHVWRMEVLGTTAGSMVNVYQNGSLVLSDNAAFNFGSGGNQVSWGDSSVIAGGRSEWTYVSTNLAAIRDTGGGTVPLPGSLALAGLGLLALGAQRRRV
jgi:hypothetical protein